MTSQPTLPAIEPKPRRRMLQPTKDTLRQTIAQQSDEINRLRIEQARADADIARMKASWIPQALRRKA